MLKISEPLNVAMKQAGKQELVLDKLDLMLLKDLIAELEIFDNITNICVPIHSIHSIIIGL